MIEFQKFASNKIQFVIKFCKSKKFFIKSANFFRFLFYKCYINVNNWNRRWGQSDLKALLLIFLLLLSIKIAFVFVMDIITVIDVVVLVIDIIINIMDITINIMDIIIDVMDIILNVIDIIIIIIMDIIVPIVR